MAEPLPLHINLDAIPWEDNDGPGRYGSHDQVIAASIRQERLDLCITRLAPGKASCPYHYHHVGEELFFVISGRGTLRIGGETRPLRANDVVSCPPGPEGAHQIINDGDEPLVYMAISTEDDAEVCEYPDSGKVLSFVKRGGVPVHKHVTRKRDAVPYMDGEPDA